MTGTPYLDDGDVVLHLGDCIEVMASMAPESIDAVVCDPPYGLGFMGRDWDGFGTPAGFQSWSESWAREALRVLKPGGHLLAFAGTRTYHRMACGVEDAGFEVRDMVRSFAAGKAITTHARGLSDQERCWLDLLALLERGGVS